MGRKGEKPGLGSRSCSWVDVGGGIGVGVEEGAVEPRRGLGGGEVKGEEGGKRGWREEVKEASRKRFKEMQ